MTKQGESVSKENTLKAEMLIILFRERGVHSIKFPLFINKDIELKSISDIDLSPRAEHCLKRSGVMTIGEFVARFSGIEDLKRLRGLGNKTADEIMFKFYLWQYESLNASKQSFFLKRVIELNKTEG